MLERLFTSKTRVKLLSEMLLNSDREYHIRELSRIIDISPIYVQKELKNLQSLGLLTSRKQGNMVLYSLDKYSTISDDLKRIFLKTDLVGTEILKSLDKSKIQFALIYGSFAKGVDTTKSDIDLLVIGDVYEDVLLKSVSKAEGKVGREISYVLWTPKEFAQKARQKIPLLLEILKTDVVMIIGEQRELKRFIKKESG
ncbi:MAG: nucleotidyltransferase domain-containing protein [Thaumarchaeota archaeon]|nr:nucleotidyltransferase domain-containing protein [Nitrososphaerota archaeon]